MVSYATNYDGTPIPSPDTRPDLAKPVIYWTPIIAPGNLMFYSGKLFPQWQGSAFTGGMASKTLNRVLVDGRQCQARRALGHAISRSRCGAGA